MATVLCPSLVALDPVPCNDPSCSASHTHTAAFCDPCKAVHAQVHASIHLASVGHRLRVDGPVAPVRCIVCCPLGSEPTAQYLFVGPEHYAVHAKTSAHRAKLAKSKGKPESGVGMGRPERSYSYSRMSPQPGSRPSSSLSFNDSAPSGPQPHPLADNEYVLCTLCHAVLPVPPVDPDYVREHGKPETKSRIVSHGSDATVTGKPIDNRRRASSRQKTLREQEDADETSTILTTTDPTAEAETRKSLVLAHHNAHDTEHARRTRFPRFKEAWERRAKKQATLAPDDEKKDEAPTPPQYVASPSQMSLSSLSASPSVAVMGLDGEDVYEAYSRALKTLDESRSVVGAPAPPPPPPPPPKQEEEEYVDWESRLKHTHTDTTPPRPSQPRPSQPPQPRFTQSRSVSSASSSSAPASEGRSYPIDSNGKRFGRDPAGRAFPVDADGRIIFNGSVPVQIPAHLLPFLSPITPSTQLDDAPTDLDLDQGRTETETTTSEPRSFKAPGPPPPLPVTIKPAVFKDPGPPPTLPKPRASAPVRPPSVPVPQRSASVSSAGQSQPYVPSPSPPPRLAFDTYGRVLKLGMRGWERDMTGLQLGPDSETSEDRSEQTQSTPQESSRGSTPEHEPEPAPESESESEPEPEPEPESEPEPEPRPRAPSPIGTEIGVPRGVATVSAPQRYTLIPGRSQSGSVSGSGTSTSASASANGSVSGPAVPSTRASSSMSMRSSSAGSGLGFGGASMAFGTGFGAIDPRVHVRGPVVETVPSHLARQASLASTLGLTGPGRPTAQPVQPVRATTLASSAPRTMTSSSSLKTSATASTGYTPASLMQSTGPTTKVTRPVVPRRATGEWALLEGQTKEGGGPGGWAPGARTLSASRMHVQSPEMLKTIGDNEDEASGSEATGRSSQSHSEASQLIREFAGMAKSGANANGGSATPKAGATTVKAATGTATVPVRTIVSRVVRDPPITRASTATTTTMGSVPARSGSLSRGTASPTPPNAFSPTPAWKSLTPASPRSQSNSSAQSSEVDEFGALGFGVDVKPFDEKGFLADLGFGLGVSSRPVSPPDRIPSPAPALESLSEGEDSPASTPTQVTRSSVTRSSVPVRPVLPTRGSTIRAPRAPSPLQRKVKSDPAPPPPPPPIPAPIPTATPTSATINISTPSSPSPQDPKPKPKSVMKTRVRARPMGTSSSVASRSVVSGYDHDGGSVVSGYDEGSVVSGYEYEREGSVVSGYSYGYGAGVGVPGVGMPGVPGILGVGVGGGHVRGQSVASSARKESVVSSARRESVASSARRESVGSGHVRGGSVGSGSVKRESVVSGRIGGSAVSGRIMGSAASGRVADESVVSGGHARRASVVSGYEGGSVVSGYGGGGLVAPESVVSRGGADEKPESEVDESEAGAPSPVVPQSRPAAPTLPRLQLQGRAYAPSDSSAASSVVTPLSPGVIRALRAGGIQIDSPVATTRPRDSEVDAVAEDFAEMYLHETAIPLDIRDEPHIGMISRVDTNSSGFTSPIAPPGAPSDAGSLFSRAVSPKFGPTIARMTMGRSTTSGPATMSTKTRTPPITPPKMTRPAGLDETPRSQRSARPDSPDNKGKGKGRANAPASVFSRGPGSNYSRGPELGWKLELPHHTDDPLTFHSFLSGMESSGQGRGGEYERADPGEITNASPGSERLTPTRSAVAASEGPMMGNAGDAIDVYQNYYEDGDDEVEEDAQGEEEVEEEDVEEGGVEGEEEGEEEDADRLTSSSEEGARTETAEDDGLDHLTESIGEPFGLQIPPEESLMHQQPIYDSSSVNRAQNENMLGSGPLYDSPRLVSPPQLPEGFDTGFVDHRDAGPLEDSEIPPEEMAYEEYDDDGLAMPDEVLSLQPVMCDACFAPMPLDKWPEHIARSGHRRNATRYAQYIFEQMSAQHPAGANRNSAEARELWAEATRLEPRYAHPSEYAYCEVCQVFLVRGDTEHFQGKKHLRCLRMLAINDAAELESVRGSVSEEEDDSSARQYQPMTAPQRGVDWTQPRVRSRVGTSSALGHQAFPPTN